MTFARTKAQRMQSDMAEANIRNQKHVFLSYAGLRYFLELLWT